MEYMMMFRIARCHNKIFEAIVGLVVIGVMKINTLRKRAVGVFPYQPMLHFVAPPILGLNPSLNIAVPTQHSNEGARTNLGSRSHVFILTGGGFNSN